MAWTGERIDALRQMLSKRLPYSEIAAELGNVSRNACIGKARRLGLTNGLPRSTHTKGQSKATKPKTRRVVRPVLTGRNYSTLHMIEFQEPEMDYNVLPASEIPIEQRRTLFQLKAHDCRWPCGDPGSPDFFFCGGEQADRGPYCAMHARLAYSKQRVLSDEEHLRRAAAARRRAAVRDGSACQ